LDIIIDDNAKETFHINGFNFMTKSIQWRSGLNEDEEWLFDLFKRTMQQYVKSAWGWDELLQKESFKTALSIQRFRILVLNGHAIGAYHISKKSDHLVLDMILIEPEFQGQGWGRSVLNKIKSEAKIFNLPIHLSVLKANPASEFHLQQGFQEFDSDDHSLMMRWNG
tara:strand:+ start:1186 stop:1686 length:501 start_codon:yes stop_codon:yes gene_type:complete